MPHSEVLSRQLGSARRLRNSMSRGEGRLWYHLRAHRFSGASFRRQAPLGPYIVDFVCHSAKLIIELDGGQHGTANHARRDAQRTAWLASRGYKVLRFWNNDVLQNTQGVLELIAAELERASPSLLAVRRRADLPRKGGGEEQAAR
jgi:very-short-patch-repair endonuclease